MFELQSIVYVSSAVREMNEAELESLLLECRSLNLETNTTGVLLYSAGGFMQCFEGTPEAVAVTYERIRASKRHYGIIELADERIGKRSFPDWQMGFMHASKSDALKLSTAVWQQRLDSLGSSSSSDFAIRELQTFWAQAAMRF